jgi:hypothetical protein
MALNKLEDEALSQYFKYKDEELKIDQILTLLGISITKLTPSDKVLAFKKAASKPENKNEIEQKVALQRFIDLCNDSDLTYKYLIQELIGAQILEKAGTSILIKESGEVIGENVKAAVIYLKNPKNGRVYNSLRAQYETVVKKGHKLPDIEITPASQEEIDRPVKTTREKGKPVVD